VFGVGTAYYNAFDSINNTLYKLIVDRSVINEARRLGLGDYVQPTGNLRPRGFNF